MDQPLIALALAAVALLVSALGAAVLFYRQARLRRKVQAVEMLLKELLKARDSTRKQLTELHTKALGAGQKITELEQGVLTVVERQQELMLQDPDSRLYSRAAKMVELGAGIEEVMAECELPKAEAELLISLRSRSKRGERSGRS